MEVPKQFKHDAKGKLDPWILKKLRFLNFINTSPTGSQIMYYLWKIRKQANRSVFIVLNYFGYTNFLVCTFTMILDYRNFLSEFFFTDTDSSQDNKEKERTIFYSNLPLLPAHEHSDIYLQLYTWSVKIYHPIKLPLLLDEIYHPIELPFDWLMMWR